jgi:hypothetical protein
MVAAVAAAALVAPGASASGVACAGCSGSYTGSWSAQIQNTTPEGTVTYGMSLIWTEMLTTPTGGNGASGVWSLASAQGTVTFTNSGSSSDDCSASLTPNLAVAGDITQFGPQVEEGSVVTVSAHPPTYWSGGTTEPLVSSDNTDPGCDFTNELAYESGFWTGFSGASCHYAGPSAADVMSFPVGPTTTIADNCDGQGSDSFGATGTATLTSQLTLTAPGPSSCAVPAGVHGAHRALWVGARSASGGSLSATVTRLPRGFVGQVTVLAVSAGDGQIVAARALARGATRTILSLPSDRYAILTDAASPADRSHNRDGIGPLVAVHAGRRTTVRVALERPAAADVDRPRAKPGHQEGGDRGTGRPLAFAAAASGPVVTVNGINLTLPDGSQVSLDDPALTDLFPTWHDQDGITFVETGKQFTDFAQHEQELSDSGRLDPPYHFDPITPDFTISGDARIDRKGRMSITIEVRERCTGQVIAQITITRRLRGGLGSIRYDAGIASALRDALSGLQPPAAASGCGCA